MSSLLKLLFKLGHVIYNSKEILPPLEFHENGLLEVWIESKYLTWFNEKVRKHFLWGTDVYSDDSDVVAGINLLFGLIFII
jgi:hypothetical protein